MPYNYRFLGQNELTLAKSVFRDSLPYDRIYLANYFLPGNTGVSVTLMSQKGGGNSIEPAIDTTRVSEFTIYCGQTVYSNGVDSATYQDTFIHELTHVWQGHNESGLTFNYMVRSLVAQGWSIASHGNRNGAYNYAENNYLKWKEYNAEQQAKIVEEWFSSNSNNGRGRSVGGSSVADPRYTYIEKIIRVGSPQASDTPSIGVAGGVFGSVSTIGFSQVV